MEELFEDIAAYEKKIEEKLNQRDFYMVRVAINMVKEKIKQHSTYKGWELPQFQEDTREKDVYKI